MVNETNVEMLYSVEPKVHKKRRFSQISPEYPNEEAIITELPDDFDISHTDVAEHIENEKEAVKNITDLKPKNQRKRKSTLEVTNIDNKSAPCDTHSKRKFSNTTSENPKDSTNFKFSENEPNSLSPSLDVSPQNIKLTNDEMIENIDELGSDSNIRAAESVLLPDKELVTSILPVSGTGNKLDIPAGENIVSDLENGSSSSENLDSESTVANRTDASDRLIPPVRQIGNDVEPAEKQGNFRDFVKMSNSDLITKISTCMNPDTAHQMTPQQNHKCPSPKLIKKTSRISSDTRNTAPPNSQSWKYSI